MAFLTQSSNANTILLTAHSHVCDSNTPELVNNLYLRRFMKTSWPNTTCRRMGLFQNLMILSGHSASLREVSAGIWKQEPWRSVTSWLVPCGLQNRLSYSIWDHQSRDDTLITLHYSLIKRCPHGIFIVEI